MPSKSYISPETPVTWSDSGNTPNELLDLGSLASDAGRVGEQLDLGENARAGIYEWQLVIDGFATAPVVGEVVSLWFAQSDGTNPDGQGVAFADGADAALASTEILRNLKYAGSVRVRSATAGDKLTARGVVALTSRYVVPVVHNQTADALNGTSDYHKVILTPIPNESQ